MTSPNAKQIVVAFDLSASSHYALARALDAARGNVLHVVCVLEPGGPHDYQYAERLQSALVDRIAKELEARASTEVVHFFVHVRIGKPAEEILMLAQEIGADSIIIGTKGLVGIERLVLGSVAEKVMREAGCSVEVARAKTYGWTPLLEVTQVERHPSYVPPHRYSYEDHRVEKRPTDWPLY
jgi:nucleotide-binding universal stress UspA family protein